MNALMNEIKKIYRVSVGTYIAYLYRMLKRGEKFTRGVYSEIVRSLKKNTQLRSKMQSLGNKKVLKKTRFFSTNEIYKNKR